MFGRTTRCIEIQPQHTIINSKEYLQKIEEFASHMGGQEAIVKCMLRGAKIGMLEDLIKIILTNEFWFDIVIMKIIENEKLTDKLKRMFSKR